MAIYGNGGLNTSYKQPIQLLGSTRGGVDISQVIYITHIGLQAGCAQLLGVAANIAMQRFAAEGLQYIAAISATPAR